MLQIAFMIYCRRANGSRRKEKTVTFLAVVGVIAFSVFANPTLATQTIVTMARQLFIYNLIRISHFAKTRLDLDVHFNVHSVPFYFLST